jgi:hypothetical protein
VLKNQKGEKKEKSFHDKATAEASSSPAEQLATKKKERQQRHKENSLTHNSNEKFGLFRSLCNPMNTQLSSLISQNKLVHRNTNQNQFPLYFFHIAEEMQS